jgi:hypothetical protein
MGRFDDDGSKAHLIEACKDYSREELLGLLQVVATYTEDDLSNFESRRLCLEPYHVTHVNWGQNHIPMDAEIAAQLKTAFPLLKTVNLFPTEPTEVDKERAKTEYGFEIE